MLAFMVRRAHVATAHAILRHNNVPIGKADYLGKSDYL